MKHALHSPGILYGFCWLCLLWPLLAIHAVYLIAAADGQVPWCVPHLEGCTSISRAARQGQANILFRASMLPWALMLAVYWALANRWLHHWLPARRRLRHGMNAFAWSGVLCLVLYAWFIGDDGEMALLMRRYGGVIFFSFTAFAHIALMAACYRDDRLGLLPRRLLMLVCLALLLLGWGSIPAGELAADGYAIVSAIEWSFALLMILCFPLVGYLWRQSQFSL